MKDLNILTKCGIVAALYVLMTMVNPLSFGPLNFRLSNLMYGFVLYKKETRPGLVGGMMLANLASPFGLADMIVGGITAMAACYFLQVKFKPHPLKQAILYGLFSGTLVGYEIHYFTSAPLLFMVITIFITNSITYYGGCWLFKQFLPRIDKRL